MDKRKTKHRFKKHSDDKACIFCGKETSPKNQCPAIKGIGEPEPNTIYCCPKRHELVNKLTWTEDGWIGMGVKFLLLDKRFRPVRRVATFCGIYGKKR